MIKREAECLQVVQQEHSSQEAFTQAAQTNVLRTHENCALLC